MQPHTVVARDKPYDICDAPSRKTERFALFGALLFLAVGERTKQRGVPIGHIGHSVYHAIHVP